MIRLRKLFIIVLATVSMLTFAACGASSFDFDKKAAVKRAEEVIAVINTRDYNAIYNLFREDLKPLISADTFKNAWEPYLSSAGAFIKITSTAAVGQTNQSGEKYIITVVRCKYENKTYVFTIVTDTNFEVTGLYLK